MTMTFKDSVREAFAFLGAAGFRTTEDVHSIRYVSDEIAVIVEWDVRSGELSVYFERNDPAGISEGSITLSDVLRMDQRVASGEGLPPQVFDEGRLAPFIERLAAQTQAFAGPLVAGDREFFERVAAFRDAESRALMQAMEIRRVAPEADRAWRAQDFARLIALLGPFEDHLGDTDKRRLDFAKRHQK